MNDSSRVDVDRAVKAAQAAFVSLATSRENRAVLLEKIAEEILALGDGLLELAAEESHLPLARLVGERTRTVFQLQLFAAVVREGSYLGLRLDSGDKSRQPLAKPDLRRMLRPLGPVGVFGASNFPLAFSAAGGDTASALAAGCPVVYKAHPAHPRTDEAVAAAISRAVATLGLPAGVFSLIQGAGNEVGGWLAAHPGIEAIGFTGSLRGGRAIFDIAAARPKPIPVYAEMGSVNPIFLLPGALDTRLETIAVGLANSVTMGVGQFCTNPGLVFVAGEEMAERFLAELVPKLEAVPPGIMLYQGLLKAYEAGVHHHAASPGVAKKTSAEPAENGCARAVLLSTDAATFAASPLLQEEVFGPTTLVVRCQNTAEMFELARGLEGQLTSTIHAEVPADRDLAAELLEILASKAGRLVWNGFPTGVEVGYAIQHGGPYPATTDSRSTSVGAAAIDRFLRPVVYQDVPEDLLPEELRDNAGLLALKNGSW